MKQIDRLHREWLKTKGTAQKAAFVAALQERGYLNLAKRVATQKEGG